MTFKYNSHPEYLIWPVRFLQVDDNYPKITQIYWYGCSANSFIVDGEEIQGFQVIEQESLVDTGEMEIEEIDVRKGESFCFRRQSLATSWSPSTEYYYNPFPNTCNSQAVVQ